MQVTVYTTPTCPYCLQAKEYLRSRKIAFIEKNVAVDSQAAQEMMSRSGQRGVPVLIMDDNVIIGFDRPRIDAALAGSESAQPRLGAAVADASTQAAKYGLGIYEGAYVGRVNPASTAERGGVKAGDVIISLAGKAVKIADDVPRIVGTLTSGKGVAAVVWRDGRQLQLELVF